MTAADIKQSALFREFRASVIHSRKKKSSEDFNDILLCIVA